MAKAHIRASSVPAAEVSAAAASAVARLSQVRAVRGATVNVTSKDSTVEQQVAVPREALELFLQVLEQLAAGNAVSVVPVHAELTTQQAADLLGVSRPYLIGLLDAGKIPSRLVGSHRRVKHRDLVEYRRIDDAKRAAAADALAAEAQELGLGY